MVSMMSWVVSGLKAGSDAPCRTRLKVGGGALSVPSRRFANFSANNRKKKVTREFREIWRRTDRGRTMIKNRHISTKMKYLLAYATNAFL